MDMKEFWKEIRIAAVMGFLLPGLLLWFGTALLDVGHGFSAIFVYSDPLVQVSIVDITAAAECF